MRIYGLPPPNAMGTPPLCFKARFIRASEIPFKKAVIDYGKKYLKDKLFVKNSTFLERQVSYFLRQLYP